MRNIIRNIIDTLGLVLAVLLVVAAFAALITVFGCGDNVPTPSSADASVPDADITDANCFTVLRTCRCTADGLDDCGITQQWDCGCYPQDGGL